MSPAKTKGYSTHQPQYPQNRRHLQYHLRNTPPLLDQTSLMTYKGFPVVTKLSRRFQDNRQCPSHVIIGPAYHSTSRRSSLRSHSLTPRADRPVHYHSNNTSYNWSIIALTMSLSLSTIMTRCAPSLFGEFGSFIDVPWHEGSISAT